MAMAFVARENNYTRPLLVKEKCINISGGRYFHA